MSFTNQRTEVEASRHESNHAPNSTHSAHTLHTHDCRLCTYHTGATNQTKTKRWRTLASRFLCTCVCTLHAPGVHFSRVVLCHSASAASREYIAHTLTPRIACTHHRSSKSWSKLLACRACAAFISFASALRIKPMTSLLHSTEPTPCSSSRRMAFLSSMLRHSACQSKEGPAGYIVRAQPGPWGAARALFAPAARPPSTAHP